MDLLVAPTFCLPPLKKWHQRLFKIYGEGGRVGKLFSIKSPTEFTAIKCMHKSSENWKILCGRLSRMRRNLIFYFWLFKWKPGVRGTNNKRIFNSKYAEWRASRFAFRDVNFPNKTKTIKSGANRRWKIFSPIITLGSPVSRKGKQKKSLSD